MDFRAHHLTQVLERFYAQTLPLDVFLSRYFRAHTAVGSKDRKFISEAVYEKIRWKGLLEHLSFEGETFNPEDYLAKEEIPPHIRLSFPLPFYNAIKEAYGEEKTWQICLTCNSKAPTTIRANLLKTTRESLLTKWKGLYETYPCKHSPWGIVFRQRINFFALPEFKEGLFEIQDEGSQLIAKLVAAKPKEQILDYCAGAGGKTLAFAPFMENKGQIYLHDIRPSALQEARKRLNRAGIQNVQFDIHPKLKGKMDWVLVDTPCSGSGTIRRNPDMKWKFDESLIPRLVQEQRQIFAKALEYLKPQGKIVYATCSLFPQENQEQSAYFQKTFKLKLVEEFYSLPEAGGMDGFYGAVCAYTQIT